MIIKYLDDLLVEETRGQLLRRSRYQSKKRYLKRLNYTISDFRGLDLKELFENDNFVYNTPIKDYICTIEFPNALTEIKKALKGISDINKVNIQLISKALIKAYNNEDKVRIWCTCPDWKYRFSFHATQGGYNAGGHKENRPAKITNPRNNIGAACKHLDLLLSNHNWVTKTASVITQFIKAFPEKAAFYLLDTPEPIKEPEEKKEPIRQRSTVNVPDEEPENDLELDVSEETEEV